MPMTPNDPALWLRQFHVELSSASPNLYGNSRQQAELRLTVEVQPGCPPLTDAQLSSLLLVYERPDGSYEQLPYAGGSTTGWWQSLERDPRYDLMPGAGAALPSAPHTASLVSKLLYVSTSQAGGSNVKLRARIQKDDTTVYYTDAFHGFDKSVVLTTVRPPVFAESDFVWERTINEGTIDNVFFHEYSLRLRSLGLSSVSQLSTPGMIRWHRNHSEETWATYVGIAPPGSKTVVYNPAIPTGDQFTPRHTAKTPGNQSMILVLNGANNIPFNREGLGHGGPCQATLVDRHGNDHVVLFHFSDDGTPLERRTNIRVSYPV